MLNSDQQKWIDHLSDVDKIVIKPYDPTCIEKFEKVENIIQKNLGNEVELKHCGATSWGISGQDEIDTYLPVPEANFDKYIPKLEKLFGKPRSHYPLKRARFVTEIDGKHIDVFLINSETDGWTNAVKFESFLRKNPKWLDKYRRLKEDGDGLSVKEYYRRKIEFINSILKKIKKNIID